MTGLGTNSEGIVCGKSGPEMVAGTPFRATLKSFDIFLRPLNN